MSIYSPDKILQITIKNGVKKVNLSPFTSIILGFQAGAFIALGYLLYIRITTPLNDSLSGLSTLIGASVFPLGLILTLIAGGELLSGNMMVVSLARLDKKIKSSQLFKNLTLITLSNFFGAITVAFLFGHLAGLTETGPYLENTVHIAEGKLNSTFLQTFISGIGCNWLVAAAVWLSYGSNDMIGKIVGIWFPTMAFVAIGFQHVVANMFVIPAAIFAGHFTWIDFFQNFVPVFLGNFVGGFLFIGTAYWFAYKKEKIETSKKVESIKKQMTV